MRANTNTQTNTLAQHKYRPHNTRSYIVAHLVAENNPGAPFTVDPKEISACRWMCMREFADTEDHPLILPLLDRYFGIAKNSNSGGSGGGSGGSGSSGGGGSSGIALSGGGCGGADGRGAGHGIGKEQQQKWRSEKKYGGLQRVDVQFPGRPVHPTYIIARGAGNDEAAGGREA